MSTLIVLGAGAVGCAFLIFNPRIEISLVLLALYLGLLDGYLKLSTGNQLLTVARDALLYAIVAGALLRHAVSRKHAQLPKYTGHVLLLGCVVAVQAANPATPGMSAAIGGIRQQLEFVPLMFLGYTCMRTQKRMRTMFALLLLIAAANAVVAMAQYSMSPQQLAGWGPGYARAVLGTGSFGGAARTFVDASGQSHPRPFGLGSDNGASGTFAWLALAGALTLLAGRFNRRWTLIGATGTMVCALGIYASQSRAALFTGVFTVIAFAALAVTSRGAARALTALVVGAILMYVGVSTFLTHSNDAASRFDSLTSTNVVSTIREQRGNSLSVTPRYLAQYPLGVGIGRAGPASSFGNSPSGLNAENEPNLLIGEVGTIGLLVFATLWLRVVFDAIRAVRAALDSNVRLYLAAIATSLLGMTLAWFALAPTVSVPTAPYFWLAAGIVARAVGPGSRLSSESALASPPSRDTRALASVS